MNISIDSEVSTLNASLQNRSLIIATITSTTANIASAFLSREQATKDLGEYPASCVVVNDLPVELNLLKQGVPINGNWKKTPPQTIAAAPSPDELLRQWKLSGEASSAMKANSVDELSLEDDAVLNNWIRTNFSSQENLTPFHNFSGYIIKSTGNGSYANAVYEFSDENNRKYRLILVMRNFPSGRGHGGRKQTYGCGLWIAGSNNQLEEKYNSRYKNDKIQDLSEYVIQNTKQGYDYACGYTENGTFTAELNEITVTVDAGDSNCKFIVKNNSDNYTEL